MSHIPPFDVNRWRSRVERRREWQRDAYARTHEQPLLINEGFGDQPLTVEIACEWAERLARDVLP